MTTEVELKEIRSLLLELNKKVEGLNKILERNLIGCEEALPDEVEATEEYDVAKKGKKLQLIPWNRAAKGTQ
jgi:hypothetical protein